MARLSFPVGLPVSGLTSAEVKAVRNGITRSGLTAVLLGDSMTDWYQFGGATLSSAIYAASTGVLTLTYSAAHLLYTGVGCRIWHYSYTSMRDQVYVPLTVTSDTVATAQLAPNLSGVPDATDIKTGLFAYLDNQRANASFVNWIQMILGWPLTVVRNAAQSGDTTAGNLRRVAADVVAYAPDIVIAQTAGINDMRSADNVADVTIISNLQQLYDQIVANGALLVIGTLTPVSSAETDRANLGTTQSVLKVNQWLRRYAAGKHNVLLLDHYRHFADVSSATGLALAARVRNDGIHPATKTAILLAKQAASALQSRIPPARSSLPWTLIDTHANSRLTISSATASGGVVTVNSTGHRLKVGEEIRCFGATPAEANGWFTVASSATANQFTYSAPGTADGSVTGLLLSRSRGLFVNPLLQTTSGGTVSSAGGNTFSGTAAAGLTVNNGVGSGCTAVASVAAAANVAATALGGTLAAPVGNEQLLAISAASANNRPQFVNVGSTAFGTQLLMGRSYVFEAVLRGSSTDWNSTPISNLACVLTIALDSSARFIEAQGLAAQDTTETDVIKEDFRIHVRTPPVTINRGTSITTGDFRVSATMQSTFSAGPVLTLGLSQIQVWDVTGSESLYA